jgi:hypothetical protein
MPKNLRIRLPPSHKGQTSLAELQARVKRLVVKCGRRFGKTFWLAKIAILAANSGRRVLYCAPTAMQTEAFWGYLGHWLRPGIMVGMVTANETRHQVKFVKSAGIITAKTASRPDHLRGDYGDLILLDEYAYQDPEVWRKICAPMLLDNDGDAVFASTGQKRNHFYLLGLAAQQNDTGRWGFYRASSFENPHLSQDALDEIIGDMTEDDYREEILAEDLEGLGDVFRPNRADFKPALSIEAACSAHAGHRLVGGMDWGRLHDYSALSIGCADCSQEILLRRWKYETYPQQRDIIKGIYVAFVGDETPTGGGKALALELLSEENSMGLPNIEQMREDGVPCNGVLMKNQNKAQMVQGLRLAFERRSWKWVWDEQSWRELEGYEQQVTRTGAISYFAAEDLHDDTVIARMLMLAQSKTGDIHLGSL